MAAKPGAKIPSSFVNNIFILILDTRFSLFVAHLRSTNTIVIGHIIYVNPPSREGRSRLPFAVRYGLVHHGRFYLATDASRAESKEATEFTENAMRDPKEPQ
jgi:hypothetical protein